MSTPHGRVNGFAHHVSLLRWMLGLLLLSLATHALAGSIYTGPYTYDTYDDPTGKRTHHSSSSASDAVEQSRAYLQEHSKPEGPWTCQVIVYSFPATSSFRLVSHRDGSADWNAECNSDFNNDEIIISATYVGYDVAQT